MAEVTEEMFFFDGGRGRKLLGFLHSPSPSAGARALLYCHPFAEEKNLSHVVAARTARKLASRGLAVLRFDMSGCGDSEGDLEEASAQAWLGEIAAAAAWLMQRTGAATLGLWGLRTGANLAARFAQGRSDIDYALLWHPVADLKVYLQQFLRQKVASGLSAENAAPATVGSLVKRLEAGEIVEVMGYPISLGLYQSLSAPGSSMAGLELACPACVLAISEGEDPPEALRKLAGSLRAHGGPADFLHVRAAPFWDRYWRWEAEAVEDAGVAWILGGRE